MKKLLLLLTLAPCLALGQTTVIPSSKTRVITNAEYRGFVNWVTDSIARRILASEISTRYIQPGQSHSKDHLKPLNWKMPIKWNSEELKYALDQLFLPEHERFYNRKKIDTRKLVFEYSTENVKNIIGVYPDTLCWITDTAQSHPVNYLQENLAKYYFWHKHFDSYPVQGITYEKARAFIYWKGKMEGEKSNKLLDGENNSITTKDNIQVRIDTDFWKISNANYKEFCFWVRDSLARRILGANLSEEYLITQDIFGDEINPPRLNWKKKIDWKDEEVKNSFRAYHFGPSLQAISEHLNYLYYWMDLNALANDKQQGMTDRSVFIIKDVLAILPDTSKWLEKYQLRGKRSVFWEDKYNNNTIAGITYEQARAFYIWKLLGEEKKIKRSKANPVGYLVFPSKDEWQAMMNGVDQKAIDIRVPLPQKIFYYSCSPKSY